MNTNKYGSKLIIWLLALSLIWPVSLKAQDYEEDSVAQQSRTYSQEELDKLLAPIALYPDTLLSQILMASTYPLEIVEADRWLKENQSLAGDSLDNALLEKSWDLSVKSLCHFPRVLDMMSEKLDLTNDLGNAFLGQQEQVMNTIQSLRAKAQAQGNLSSTDKQKVIYQEDSISIEPATPDVVYVPSYDPCWAYGPWWYSGCSPLWFWYPNFFIGAGFYFWPPIYVGPLGFWCGFHWYRHEIFLNVNRTYAFHRHPIGRMHGGTEVWVHKPVHRRGIAYSDRRIARRFGQIPRPGADARRAFRGFAPESRRPESSIIQRERHETEHRMMEPRNINPSSRPFEHPIRSQQRQTEMSPQSGTAGFGHRQFTPHQRSNAFESFGSSGREVNRQSERGQMSIGGSRRGGGEFHGGGFHGRGRNR